MIMGTTDGCFTARLNWKPPAAPDNCTHALPGLFQTPLFGPARRWMAYTMDRVMLGLT
jgi:hypothetical protein